MAISDDIFNNISVLNFTYIENYENSLLKEFIDDGTTTITLKIKQLTEGFDPLICVYVIDELRIVGGDVSTTTYRIKAVNRETQLLQSYVNMYSNTKDAKELINSLLSKSKIKPQIDLSEMKSSGNAIEFVSEANETIKSQINRILDMASSEKSVYFLVYNYYKKKYRIVEYSKEANKDRKTILKAIPSNSFHVSGTNLMFTKTEKKEGLSPLMSYSTFCNLYSNSFDTKKREWNRLKINDIEKLEQSICPSDDYEFIFKEQTQQADEKFMFRDVYSNGDNIIKGKINRYLFLHAERLEVELIGDLDMELGNFIALTDNFMENYGGVWMISAVNHWLEKDKFTTVMTLSRGFRLKSEVIQRGNGQQ